MRKNKLYFEVAVLAACLLYLYYAREIPLGFLRHPGPGFFPLMLGLAGLVIAAALVAGSVMELRKSPSGKVSEAPVDRKTLLRAAAYLAAVAVLVALYETLGSLITIFVMVLALAKISGMRGWLWPSLLGLVTTVCIYLIFVRAFQIPLPSGVIGPF